MSRISFLVGFDRIAQSAPADIAGAAEPDTNAKRQCRRELGKKNEEQLAEFWEETRLGLVRRMREKNETEASADRAPTSALKNLNMFMTIQIKKKVHAAKVAASQMTRFIVHPNDPRKLYWDLFVGMLIVYSVVVIPWRISYKQDADGAMLYFDYGVDCVFVADIVLCFNAAYFEEEGLVYKRKIIARRYLSTWFVPDVMGTLPLAWLTKLFINTVYASSNLQGVKLLRVVRGIRLLKLMRILRLSRKMAQVDFANHINPSVVRLIKLLGKIVFAAHLLGCMWFLVDECEADGGDDLWQTCGGAGLGSKYLASLYWTIATLMSVGYGEISANNNRERLYALVTMVIGSTAFGFIIAMVTVIVETMDPQATAINRKMDEVREYMGVRKLPNNLQLRMRKHFDHVYRNTSVFREVPILRDLPYALRVKLVLDTHQGLLRKLAFFEGLDMPVLTEMVYRLKPMQLKRKEYVGKAGDVLDDVFFVVKGRVEARLSKPGKLVLVALHSVGSDFELSSLVLCRPMQFTYRAVVQTELMWLDKDDLETITIEHPMSEELITKKAERQDVLLEQCLAQEDSSNGSDCRKAMVIVDWKLVPAESASELMGDGLMSIVDASRPDDADGTLALIRTLRPIGKATSDGKAKTSGSAVGGGLGSMTSSSDAKGDGNGGTMIWNNEGSKTLQQPLGDTSASGYGNGKDTQSYSVFLTRQHSSVTEDAAAEEEQERKERTPPNMEEALETAESVASRWVVLPNASWKQKWEMFCMSLISLSVVVVPFRIGFDALPKGGWLVIDIITDFAFAFDIMINFRLAYVDGHVLVTSPSLMAKHYLRGWFTFDLLSTLPFDRIMSLAMGDGKSTVFRGLRLVKVVRMVRLLRLFRLLKLARFKLLTEEFMELNTVLFRGLKLVLTLAVLGHFFGCFWSFVSLSEETDTDDDSVAPSMWWKGLGLQEEDLTGRYIASIYWAFTTMTTVGYGDILPVVDLERAYATIIMVIGATVFGYIVGSVSALASNPNGSQARETFKILRVSNYLDEKKVQQKLRQAVKKHVEHHVLHKSPFDEESLQALMPPSLRQESTIQIHKDIIGKIAIFKHLNSNHVAYTLRLMKPCFTMTGNFVFNPVHGSDGVYFMLDGMAEAVQQEEGADRYETLHHVQPGKFFGHEAFLYSDRKQPPGVKKGVRALVDSSMYLLSEGSILDLVDTQPDLMAKLQRALRCAISEQELVKLASPVTRAAPSKPGVITSARAFIGGGVSPNYDIGAVESGTGGEDGGVSSEVGSVSERRGGGGSRVVPVEG